jgi:hypothetical protein
MIPFMDAYFRKYEEDEKSVNMLSRKEINSQKKQELIMILQYHRCYCKWGFKWMKVVDPVNYRGEILRRLRNSD